RRRGARSAQADRRTHPPPRACAPAAVRAGSPQDHHLSLAGLLHPEPAAGEVAETARVAQRRQLDLELALLVLEAELHVARRGELVAEVRHLEAEPARAPAAADQHG